MTDFNLLGIIKAAGTDPAEVTEAIWAAGYRRSEQSAANAVNKTLRFVRELHSSGLPPKYWPKDYIEILQGELNDVVVEAIWEDSDRPMQIAKAVSSAGYRLNMEARSNGE